MLGFNGSQNLSAPENIYLYNTPFIRPNTVSNQQDFIIEYLDEADRIDVEKLHAMLFRFSLEQEIVYLREDSVKNSINQNTGSWIWFVNWMNFRSLVVLDQYGKLMSSLQASNGEAINQLLDLHVRLGILFSDKLLNTVVNRVIRSTKIIPYAGEEDTAKISWERIHQETPFIWMIILLQTVIRSNVSKL